MTRNRIIPLSELWSFLRRLGIPESSLKLADETFALPTLDYVRKFAEAYGPRVEAEGASEWLEQVFDCENHAQRAALWMNDAHRLTWRAGLAPKSGLAFGEVWIGSHGHAVNCAVHTTDDDKLVFACYEPQLRGPKHIGLTPYQLRTEDFPSIQLVKFQ